MATTKIKGACTCTNYDYRRTALKAAKELLYPITVIERIQNAKSESEIIRIMETARRES